MRPSNFDIQTTDEDPNTRDLASAPGPQRNRYSTLSQNAGRRWVAGRQGYGAFKLHQEKLLSDGAFLASCSSTAFEFNRADFVDLAIRYPDDMT